MTTDTPPDLSALPPLRAVIAAQGLAARKGLGQHFLLDMNVTRKIAAAAGDLAGVHVVEIGPGPGGLTRALLESGAAHVTAIEKDPRCVAALSPLVEAAKGRLSLIQGDAMKADLSALVPAPRAVVANLPYNVGTELLIGWLQRMADFESLTLMFQAEVADRLVAAPGTSAYGRLSVITQHVAEVRRVMRLPARAFTPPPQVDSAVVRLAPRTGRPSDVDLSALERVTAAAFGQRRKMLRSSLKSLGGLTLLEKTGIAPDRRAETLTLAEFEALARTLGRLDA